MEINKSNVIEIVTKAGLKPDKDYGQNFLIEPSICSKIVDALNINKDDKILEIGPGLGSLTHYISLNKNNTVVVDIDKRMTDFLKVVYQENNNIEIIENDIRKVDISDYNKIIGNLPYNITTEAIQFVLLNGEKLSRSVFMIQSEVLAHFIDVDGKEYGPTSVLIHLLGNIEKLFTVKAGSFYPAPKCSSIVFSIDIDPNKDRLKAIGAFKIAKSLFLNRRKTILNNLTTTLKNRDLANSVCVDLGINPLLRPEQLLPEMYLKIYEYLENKK